MLNGKYPARATGEYEWGMSPNGHDFVWINFDLEEVEDGEQQSIGAYVYFSDASAARAIESLRACGCTFPANDITNLEGLGSKPVQLVIEPDTYEGKTKPKVRWINAQGGIKDDQKMNAVQKASFKDRMKGALLATAGSSPPADPAAPKVDDSDIPF